MNLTFLVLIKGFWAIDLELNGLFAIFVHFDDGFWERKALLLQKIPIGQSF